MVEEDLGELAGGIKIGPINSGATISGVEDEGREGRVKRREEREIRGFGFISVSVPRMYAWSLSSFPQIGRAHV